MTEQNFSSYIKIHREIQSVPVYDGEIIASEAVDTISINSILQGILATIPEETYNLEPTSTLYQVNSGYSDVLMDFIYWSYFAKLCIALDTCKYDRLDYNFGELLNIKRFDGNFESAVYTQNPITVNPGDLIVIENLKVIRNSINVYNTVTGVTYEDGEDYKVNKKNNYIEILSTTSIPAGTSVAVSYLTKNYDENLDETYDYNPYETEISEDIFITSDGVNLKYINIMNKSEKIKLHDEDIYYFRDLDYTIDYVNGQIHLTPGTNINPYKKVTVTYRTEINVNYKWSSTKENLTVSHGGDIINLAQKTLNPESIYLYAGVH